MKATLVEVTGRVEKLTSTLMEAFHGKMQKAGEGLQEKLSLLQSRTSDFVDRKLEEQSLQQANAARDQLAEIYLKVNQFDCIY